MGSFDMACGLTGLNIQAGEPASAMLLTRPFHVDPSPRHFTSSTAMFQPFLTPIKGEYNDYGSLENIQESPTTRTLETLTGLTVEQIMEYVSGSHGIYMTFHETKGTPELNNNFYGMKSTAETFGHLGFTETINGGTIPIRIS